MNLVNEDNLSFQLPRNRDPEITAEFRKRWRDYLRCSGATQAGMEKREAASGTPF
ncbi:MAG: hypothetical protein L6W00_16425 [Lentisphaeria bacterium]|nr:MAG: hypothetical protein L6W00_16425 [Lentisphaeria bacterium]